MMWYDGDDNWKVIMLWAEHGCMFSKQETRVPVLLLGYEGPQIRKLDLSTLYLVCVLQPHTCKGKQEPKSTLHRDKKGCSCCSGCMLKSTVSCAAHPKTKAMRLPLFLSTKELPCENHKVSTMSRCTTASCLRCLAICSQTQADTPPAS
eukprot:scaffold86207_cov32-Tisochrysis_lutea.AAC.3